MAVACISASTGNLKDIKQSLRTFAKWLADKLELQVTTVGPSCPIVMESKLVWRQFLHESLKFMVANGAGKSDQAWSAWVRIAKLAIRRLPNQPFAPVELLEGPPDTLHYETIHQVKGETHDVTGVVSSQQPGPHQSHRQDWLRDRGSEAARFAYVASSRPQHMLIWAAKKLKEEDRPALAQLGFEAPPADNRPKTSTFVLHS